MAGSSNQFVYQLGVTLLAIPALSVVQVIPPRTCIGSMFGYVSGGSLSIMNGAGSSGGLGGIMLGATTAAMINVDGPATFFLAATGATSVAGIVFKYSSGFSLTP